MVRSPSLLVVLLTMVWLFSHVVEARTAAAPRNETTNSTAGGGRARRATRTDDDSARRQQRDKDDAERSSSAQQEARRRRAHTDKAKMGKNSAKTLIRAGETEECDWTKNPIPFLKGELCGAHYKVLGLDRKGKLPDKAEIKKAYRQRSLEVHPDKNPSPEAAAAFKVVQDAYECLSDAGCQEEYEWKLSRAEERIAMQRQLVTDTFLRQTQEVLLRANYYATVAANYVYTTAMDVWEACGEFEVTLFDEPRPVGKWVVAALLFWKGRVFLKAYGLSYAILRINHELAQTGFFEQFQGF